MNKYILDTDENRGAQSDEAFTAVINIMKFARGGVASPLLLGSKIPSDLGISPRKCLAWRGVEGTLKRRARNTPDWNGVVAKRVEFKEHTATFTSRRRRSSASRSA